MRVTRLEVFGFKSFMDRLVLPLDGGITGVVGPNGCGKSNTVDALRWVLGETNAKNLRGDLLEDVIFSGTDKLRPLGLAEVTITLRSTGENFFADLASIDHEAEMMSELAEAEAKMKHAEAIAEETADGPEEEEAESDSEDEESRPKLTVIDGNKGKVQEEGATEKELPKPKPAAYSATLLHRFSWLKTANEVQVTRRLYRSGESEFFINRVSCRLKDVKEFFRAVGMTARAYTIVAQGQVSRIISAKPSERRLIIEEAAGVLGFRDKIAASERRLQDTTINISRIEDIYNEISRHVRSLARQAAKAKNREALKEEVAVAERELYADALLRLRQRKEEATKTLTQTQDQEQKIDAQFQEIRAREEQARSELMSIDVEGDDLRMKIDSIREELNNRAKRRNEKTSRIEELKAFSLAAETEMTQLNERREDLVSRQERQRSEIAGQEDQEKQLSTKESHLKSVLRGQVEKIQDNLKSKRELLQQKQQELTSVEAVIESADAAAKSQLLDAARGLRQLVAVLAEEIAVLERSYSDDEGEREALEGELRSLSTELGHARGSLERLRAGLRQVEVDLEKTVARISEIENKVTGYKADRERMEQELESLASGQDDAIQAQLQELQEKYHALDGVRSKNRTELGEFAERVDTIRRELDSARSGLSDGQLELQKVEMESDHLHEKIRDDYSSDLLRELLAADLQMLEDERREELQEIVAKLKARIAREGEVDPTSIERHEEEKQRLEDLESQKTDLESAAATLRKTIEKLRVTSQERFVETFDLVKENFSTLIPRLFGGGMGELELTDPRNPLDSGVLINVRPPGKKLKSIDLLSGGEKALCATALIMAMFLVRPSPLCVLDEVDAPLDDANLVRFLSVIKEMSLKTQFLMITHNKGSMSSADRLVGVTMEQPGASKIITVSLQEAYSQVA